MFAETFFARFRQPYFFTQTGYFACAIAFALWAFLAILQNRHFGSKIKIVKNMRKTILEPHKIYSVQKTAPKNTEYSKNDNISKMAKIAHHAN